FGSRWCVAWQPSAEATTPSGRLAGQDTADTASCPGRSTRCGCPRLCTKTGRFLAIARCGKHNGALRTLARPPQTEYISMQALRAHSLTHHPHVVLDEHGEERWLPRKNCPAIRNAPSKRPNAPRRHGVRRRCCRPHASCSPYTTQDGTTIPSCTISRRPQKCP